ncbi:MAG: acyl CoA:acetate/3-ketoacid CoA transferase [Alphaproteobacteria bacterium]|nr:acyl CoA:acetate/3-ketoacid CoA transferase [Alphaproteobacteria bacterium]
MAVDKFVSAAAAAQAIKDGDTIAICGSGGGLLEPDFILAAIEARFLASGYPRNLTLIHAQGIGDRHSRGLNRLAHEGLVKRVIGGHWTWSPRMQDLARMNKIEAYALPGGVISLVLRETGAGRSGLISPIGLGTFVDPRHQGGRMNEAASENLVELITLKGQTLLHYLPLPVDVAILRGTSSDPAGNISFEREPANLDAYALALAAHHRRGLTLVQIERQSAPRARQARDIIVPAALVSSVICADAQPQSHAQTFDPSLCGGAHDSAQPAPPPLPTGLRGWIAKRAALEAPKQGIIAFGFGMPDGVAALLAQDPNSDLTTTIDHGISGGQLLTGDLFGFVRNPDAILNATDQLDFYHGGGVDIAFLGFGEVDALGNVNASMIAGRSIGPGGFMDIAHGARKIVFCGTFDALGSQVDIKTDRIQIVQQGREKKFVQQVAQITFCAKEALKAGKQVLYVTERAVFKLQPEGLALIEISNGIDLTKDVLERMDFTPRLAL